MHAPFTDYHLILPPYHLYHTDTFAPFFPLAFTHLSTLRWPYSGTILFVIHIFFTYRSVTAYQVTICYNPGGQLC